MKTCIKYLTFTSIVVIVLTIGILIGQTVEKHHQEVIAGKLQNSTKIAVVNLDEGIEYAGEHRNFSTEIIQNYSSDYVVTGLNDATTGIEEGRYSAYIILPSTFSSNVTSINTQPVKTMLEYKISGNLSEIANDNAWVKVMEFEEQLNDDLGYIFLHSILTEFHGGQESALAILENDAVDKEILMAISNFDLVASLDLTEVERLQNNIEELSISEDFEVNQAIINDIDLAYKGYLKETTEEVDGLKNESNVLVENLTPIEDATSEIYELFTLEDLVNYELEHTELLVENYLRPNQDALDNLENLFVQIEDVKSDYGVTTTFPVTLQSEFQNLQSLIERYSNQVNGQYEVAIINTFSPYESGEVASIDEQRYPQLYRTVKLSEQEIVASQNKTNLDNMILSIMFSDSGLTYFDSLEGRELLDSLNSNVMIQEQLQVVAEDMGMPTPLSLVNYINTISLDGGTVNQIQLEGVISEALLSDIQVLSNNVVVTVDGDEIDILEIQNSITNIENRVYTIYQGIEEIEVSYTGVRDELQTLLQDTLTFAIEEDMRIINEIIKGQKTDLLSIISPYRTEVNTFNDTFNMYDPLKFIDSNEIQFMVENLSDNNHIIKNKFDDKSLEYEQFVSDSYKNADEHIQTLKQDVLDYQQASDEKLTTGLEQAKASKEATVLENSILMNSFINKLPYTKNGTIENTVVYDFITAPNEVEGNKAVTSTFKYNLNYLIYLYMISGVLILVTMIMLFFYKYKKRVNDK